MDSNRPYNLDDELASIEDSTVKEFVTKALSKVPEYFWHVPASASGRFHPLDTLGDGGLVLHTKRVVYLATEIAKVFKIEGENLDILKAASILHDSFKNGIADEGHTEEDHPLIVRHQLQDLSAETEYFEEIMEAIECHQGLWGPQPLRMPKKPIQWALHIADFVASRSAVYLYFSGYNPPKAPAELDFSSLTEDLAESIGYYLDLRVKRAEIEKQMEEIKQKISEEMVKREERKVFSTKGSARLIGNTHYKINQPKLKEVLDKLGLWDKVAMANEKRLQELIADGLINEADLDDAIEKVEKDAIRILPRED